MPSRFDDVRAHMAHLEHELEGELLGARQRWRYRVDAGRVRFQHDVRQGHQRLKQGIPGFIRDSSPLTILTAPVIYSLIVPVALLDLWVSAYQRVCFPLYAIPRAPPSPYIVLYPQPPPS